MVDEAQGEILFKEEQRFAQWWLWLLLYAIAFLAWWGFIVQIVLGRPWGTNPAPDWAMWLIVVICGVFIPIWFLGTRLVTTLRQDQLDVHFRLLHRRRIPTREIRSCESVTYRPLREFGGWGIRWGGKRGWAYNMRGNRGVQLVLEDGKRLLVGSFRPDELAAALERAGVTRA